jgi:S-ribosylhomocysteine lyase LuxS involved in autoinducer biosynthesis
VSTRGKNAGKPITSKKKVARGCGSHIILWSAALIKQTGEVLETFKCPGCGQPWKKIQLSRVGETPVETFYGFQPLGSGPKTSRLVRFQRKLTNSERRLIENIDSRGVPYWYPNDPIDMGREMLLHGLQRRGEMTVSDFFFKRQLWALGRLWREFDSTEVRLSSALKFLFTSLHNRYSKRTKWHISRFGQGAMPNNLYIPSLMVENNILDLCVNKFSDICAVSAFVGTHGNNVVVRKGSATRFSEIPDSSVDYIFADPPFGQNIYYADCSLLWEGWLQEFTYESKEIVVSERRTGGNFKDLGEYRRLMTDAFTEMFRVLKPNRWATIEFNNSDGSVFEAIKAAVTSVGFRIANMLLLDKDQKTYKQIQGAKGEADVVDKDVLFNLHKPAVAHVEVSAADHDLEHQVADAVRQHLQTLPERIKAEPSKYNDEHRTTATINSMLMNVLIPAGVSVERLNLPFIERVCARYFRKVGNRWYLRGQAVGSNGGDALVEEEVVIKDEVTAIDWLRQKLHAQPALIGELKPLWMRATGLLPAALSQSLNLDFLLTENFWRDPDTNRWREPTAEERERMNDDRSLRVLHDAERYLGGSLARQTTDDERCRWIEVLYKACRDIEEKQAEALPALRGFDADEAYRVITRLFQSVLKDHVTADVFRRAEKQCRAASSKITSQADQEKEAAKAKKKDDNQTTMDLFGEG